MSERKPIVGITMGDPAGSGPEITVKALLDPRYLCTVPSDRRR